MPRTTLYASNKISKNKRSTNHVLSIALICLALLTRHTNQVRISITGRMMGHHTYTYDYINEQNTYSTGTVLNLMDGQWVLFPHRLEFHPKKPSMIMFNHSDSNKYLYLEPKLRVLVFYPYTGNDDLNYVSIQKSLMLDPKYQSPTKYTLLNPENYKPEEMSRSIVFRTFRDMDYDKISEKIHLWNKLPWYEFTQPQYYQGNYYNHILYFAGPEGQKQLGQVIKAMPEFPMEAEFTESINIDTFNTLYRKLIMRLFRHVILQKSRNPTIPKKLFLTAGFIESKGKINAFEKIFQWMERPLDALCVEFLNNENILNKVKQIEEVLRRYGPAAVKGYLVHRPLHYLRDVFRVEYKYRHRDMNIVQSIMKFRKSWRRVPAKWTMAPGTEDDLMVYDDPGMEGFIEIIFNVMTEEEKTWMKNAVSYLFQESKPLFEQLVKQLQFNLEEYKKKSKELGSFTFNNYHDRLMKNPKDNPGDITKDQTRGFYMYVDLNIDEVEFDQEQYTKTLEEFQKVDPLDFVRDVFRFDYIPLLVEIHEARLLENIFRIKQFEEMGIDLLNLDIDIANRSLNRMIEMFRSIGVLDYQGGRRNERELGEYLSMRKGYDNNTNFTVYKKRRVLV